MLYVCIYEYIFIYIYIYIYIYISNCLRPLRHRAWGRVCLAQVAQGCALRPTSRCLHILFNFHTCSPWQQIQCFPKLHSNTPHGCITHAARSGAENARSTNKTPSGWTEPGSNNGRSSPLTRTGYCQWPGQLKLLRLTRPQQPGIATFISLCLMDPRLRQHYLHHLIRKTAHYLRPPISSLLQPSSSQSFSPQAFSPSLLPCLPSSP